MSDIIFNVLTTIVATAAGAAWYMEFIRRRKVEADLMVERQMRRLHDISQQLDANKAVYGEKYKAYAVDAVHGDMLEYLGTNKSDSGRRGSGSSGGTGESH